ncbi:MAG: PfkB family carbohydrate kinase, partial [Planctomycetaceae bacterium]
EVLAELVPLASHLVFSDAGLLLHAGAVHAGQPAAGAVDEALLVVASRTGACHVGASCGAEGYAWVEEGRVRRVPAPRVDAIDTLAAGDILHGALALRICEGAAVAEAARFAVAAASLKCTRFGGRLGCPSRAEVDAWLEGRVEGGTGPRRP